MSTFLQKIKSQIASNLEIQISEANNYVDTTELMQASQPTLTSTSQQSNAPPAPLQAALERGPTPPPEQPSPSSSKSSATSTDIPDHIKLIKQRAEAWKETFSGYQRGQMCRSVSMLNHFHQGLAAGWEEGQIDHNEGNTNPFLPIPPIIDLIEFYIHENYNEMWQEWSSGGAQYNFGYLCPINEADIDKWATMLTVCGCGHAEDQTSYLDNLDDDNLDDDNLGDDNLDDDNLDDDNLDDDFDDDNFDAYCLWLRSRRV